MTNPTQLSDFPPEWGPLDRHFAQLLVLRRLGQPQELKALYDQGRQQRWQHQGSILAGSLIRTQRLHTAQVDMLLQVVGSSAQAPAPQNPADDLIQRALDTSDAKSVRLLAPKRSSGPQPAAQPTPGPGTPGSGTPGSGTHPKPGSGSYAPTPGSGSYNPGSGSYTPGSGTHPKPGSGTHPAGTQHGAPSAPITQLDQLVGQFLVARGWARPDELAAMWDRGVQLGPRGGSALLAAAVAANRLSPANADMLLKTLGGSPTASTSGASNSDSLIDKALSASGAQPDGPTTHRLSSEQIRNALAQGMALAPNDAEDATLSLPPGATGAALAVPDLPASGGDASDGEATLEMDAPPLPIPGQVTQLGNLAQPVPAALPRRDAPQPDAEDEQATLPVGAKKPAHLQSDSTLPMGGVIPLPHKAPPQDAEDEQATLPIGAQKPAHLQSDSTLPMSGVIPVPGGGAAPRPTDDDGTGTLPLTGPPLPLGDGDATLQLSNDLPGQDVRSGQFGAFASGPQLVSSMASGEWNDGLVASTHGSNLPPDPEEVRAAEAVRQVFDGQRYEVVEATEAHKQRVRDRRVGREVVLRRSVDLSTPEAIATFERLPKVLAQLDHPSIPKVHDAGEGPDGVAYFTTDRLEGRSLQEVARGLSWDDEAALQPLLRAFLSVCAAVAHANGRGLVHCELGPECVRLGTFGRVWVVRWEGAWPMASASEAVQRAASAPVPHRDKQPSWLAPEVRNEENVTPRADVWGLGVVLHYLLCGTLPTRNGPAPSLEKAAQQGRPRQLVAVVRKALAEKTHERYVNAQSVLDDVRRYLDGQRVTAERESFFRALRRLIRHRPAVAGAGALAALVVIAVFAVSGMTLARATQQARAAAAGLNEQLALTKDLEDLARERRKLEIETGNRTRGFERIARAVEAAAAEPDMTQALDQFDAVENTARGLLNSGRARASEIESADDPDAQASLEGLSNYMIELDRWSEQIQWSRAQWILRHGDARALTRAYDDLTDLTRDGARFDPQLLLTRFKLARRLDAQRTQDTLAAWTAHTDSPSSDGTNAFATLGSLAQIVRTLHDAEHALGTGESAEARRLGRDAEAGLTTLLQDAGARRWLQGEPLVLELRARAAWTQFDAPPWRASGADGERLARALRDFQAAALLAPYDPEPRWRFALAYHDAVRSVRLQTWLGARALRHALDASALTERGEPDLLIAGLLHREARYQESSERVSDLPGDLDALLTHRGDLLQARWERINGQVQTHLDNARGAWLQTERAVLAAWTAWITDDDAQAVEQLRAAWPRLEDPTTSGRLAPDVLAALSAQVGGVNAQASPPDPTWLLSQLDEFPQTPPPPGGRWDAGSREALLETARALLGAALDDTDRVAQSLERLAAVRREDPGAWSAVEATRARARVASADDTAQARVAAMLLWAQAFWQAPHRRAATEAQGIVTQGAPPQASSAFQAIDLDELWVPRDWEPALEPEEPR